MGLVVRTEFIYGSGLIPLLMDLLIRRVCRRTAPTPPWRQDMSSGMGAVGRQGTAPLLVMRQGDALFSARRLA